MAATFGRTRLLRASLWSMKRSSGNALGALIPSEGISDGETGATAGFRLSAWSEMRGTATCVSREHYTYGLRAYPRREGWRHAVHRFCRFYRADGGNRSAFAATALRRELRRASSELRVSNMRTQLELISRHTVRERLLAWIAVFFAIIALLLASVGLYGVLYHSVLQRRREIGIRLAIGAPNRDIVRRTAGDPLLMVCAGACAGIGLSIAFGKFAASVLYGVEPTDISLFLAPTLVIFSAATLACLPAVTSSSHRRRFDLAIRIATALGTWRRYCLADCKECTRACALTHSA